MVLFSIQFGISRKIAVASSLLHYFEHVLIVIYRVADGDSSEVCGECICSGTKNSVLDGLSSQLQWLQWLWLQWGVTFSQFVWLIGC